MEKWADAYKQRQIATLSSLLAEDYVITVEDGSTYGKVGFISHSSGALRVDTAEMSDLKIRMHGNIAVVTGAYRERGESNGRNYDYHDRLTDVWMMIGGKWQLIASHYSVPESLLRSKPKRSGDMRWRKEHGVRPLSHPGPQSRSIPKRFSLDCRPLRSPKLL